MEIKHVGHKGTALDPTLDALEMVVEFAGPASPDRPVTPEAFWKLLSSRGFYFMQTTRDGRIARVPDQDPSIAQWGLLYAELVLRHAAAKGLVGGDDRKLEFWPK